MLEKKQKEICKIAVDTFGATNQKIQAMQELAELTKEITKEIQGCSSFHEVIDEIVDCEIMITQLKLMYIEAKPSQVRKYNFHKELKLDRLKKLCEDYKTRTSRQNA
jgi:hypothetical protein